MVTVYATYRDPLFMIHGWAWSRITEQGVHKSFIFTHEYIILVGDGQFMSVDSVAESQEAIRITNIYCNDILYIDDIIY